jgi:hypothetical protein
VTFLQRVLVGWTRSRGVKLVPFSEKERTNVAVKRYVRGLTPVAHPCPQTSSWTSAHAQGYFSATILVLVVFDGFALSPCYRDTAAGAQIGVGAPLVLSGAAMMRVAAECPAVLIRDS